MEHAYSVRVDPDFICAVRSRMHKDSSDDSGRSGAVLTIRRQHAYSSVANAAGEVRTYGSVLRACSRSLLNSATYADAQENVSK
jgi:hypothetical protein